MGKQFAHRELRQHKKTTINENKPKFDSASD